MSVAQTFQEVLARRMANEKARQDSRAYNVCPCCGQNMLRHPIDANPKSKYADLFICQECSTSDAAIEKMGAGPRRPWDWACVQPKVPAGDFIALDGATAWQMLQQDGQLSVLAGILRRYLDDPDKDNEYTRAAYDFKARGMCKGILHTNMRLAHPQKIWITL